MSQLWKELHTRALQYNGINDSAYIAAFGKKIPRYTAGCSCHEFWKNWIKTNPPIYGQNNEYFEWTVKTHNAVNAKLGKPQISVEDAKTLY